MENTKQYFLSDKENEESLIYVCYERSMYHLFCRNLKVNRFVWLFADRFIGFNYSEGNEPILPIQNGFGELISNIQEVYRIERVDFKEVLLRKFRAGYVAYGMMKIIRKDGSEYTTSSLFEECSEIGVIYTKTGRTNRETRLFITFDEMWDNLPKDLENKVEIVFLKPSEKLQMQLQREGRQLFTTIMSELYGIVAYNGALYSKQEGVLNLSGGGLDGLISYCSNNKEFLIQTNMTEHERLRLHRHISNKILPLIYAWKSILDDKECYEILDGKLVKEINRQGTMIIGNLNELLKYASLFFSKRKVDFLNKYISSLENLAQNMNIYQKLVYMATVQLLS